MCLEVIKRGGKRERISVEPASGIHSTTTYPAALQSIFTVPVQYADQTFAFLIDSGADISVLPIKLFSPDSTEPSRKLVAANNVEIKVHGQRTLSMKIIGFNQKFQWKFIVADVIRPILGADFLLHYGALVDCKHARISIGQQSSTTQPINEVQLSNTSESDTETVLKIETHGPPIAQRSRRLGGHILSEVRKEFDSLISGGIIRESKSEWASPIVVVKKKDGTFRPCGDYRALNAVTKADRYPLPRITDILDRIGGKQFFSTYDLVKAYHQIRISEDDIHKTAVITPFGLYEYCTMPFGLKNASQTFQRHMDKILRPFREYACCYIDDIIVFSSSEEEHAVHNARIRDALSRANLSINLDKCNISKQCVNFLGFQISSTGIAPQPGKIQSIIDFRVPNNTKALRRFIGAITFYQWIIPNLSSTISSLHELVAISSKNKQKYIWTEKHRHAFEETKEKLRSATEMCPPDYHRKFILCTDASNTGIGASLNHRNGNGKLQPIAFFSRKLSTTEQKYSTFDRELLAVYLSIKNFKHHLEGNKFELLTDHKPLTHLTSMKEPSNRQWRWIQYINQFDVEIHHIRGQDNQVADCLSRQMETEINQLVPSSIAVADLIREQKSCNLKESLKDASLKLEETKDGILIDTTTNAPRIILPQSYQFNEFHRIHDLCHPGTNATLKQIKSKYVWPGMRANIREWCRQCEKCQKNKVSRHTKSELKQLPDLGKFKVIHIDIVGPLPSVNNKKYILSIIDRHTAWPEAIPISEITSEIIIKTIEREWICRYGVPEILITDNGRQFTSSNFKTFCDKQHIEHRRTTPYHPQCNGKVERFHRTLKAALRTHSDNCSKSWANDIHMVMMGLRNTISEDTGQSLSQAVFDTNLRMPGDLVIKRRKQRWKTYFPKALKTCTHVWMLSESRTSLQPVYDGPFEVISRSQDLKTYEIKLPNRVTRVSVDKLKPAFLSESVTKNTP